MMLMRRLMTVMFAATLLSGRAETTVSDVVVNQRWPWSEKVDVDFTLTGERADVDVTATWDGQSAPVLLGTVFAAAPGLNRVTWDPTATPYAGQTLTGFSVTVAPASADAHRYLVIDLQNGGVSYRVEPDGTDGKWTDAYKTTKMAFRRIPAGTYQLGMESNQIAKVAGGPIESAYATAWKPHEVTFSSDYYVGVFKLTGAQYNLLTGVDVGSDKTPKFLSYDELRGEVTSTHVNWPTSHYEVAVNSLVDKFRRKVGAGLVIDLCQECQWEVAMRAGTTTFWPNGGTMEDGLDALTAVVGEIAWRNGTHEVGLLADNGWGIYDPVGLCPEWTLDKCAKIGGNGILPRNGLSGGEDPVGSSSAQANYRVYRGGMGSALRDLLPCRRCANSHNLDGVAGARFCIHLKPLNFPK